MVFFIFLLTHYHLCFGMDFLRGKILTMVWYPQQWWLDQEIHDAQWCRTLNDKKYLLINKYMNNKIEKLSLISLNMAKLFSSEFFMYNMLKLTFLFILHTSTYTYFVTWALEWIRAGHPICTKNYEIYSAYLFTQV